MNEEILIYNTPTSEEILRKIHQHELKRLWKDNLAKNNRNLIWIIFCVIFATVTFISSDYTFTSFFTGFGIATLSSYFTYYFSYRKFRKKYLEILEKEISNQKLNSKDVIWEFTSTHFSFKNYKAEYKFIWSEVTYCILDDKYLYITASSQVSFILDKANINEENLNKTILYLEKHSRFEEI
ncbi:hypothetical protein [Chryseobacterium turcicum]|uniref:YcxB-like protein domain-containing protein n=1 Tax=Chryseobacterium turcicum TaxID=2898076 RepID=A0A9Q3V2L1_9FLAO|nr:hypothetical protein [Chryseobacterium turcicum]MCD1115924.1 hypothetical protein [Chryseobacterium turcicum]